SSINRRLVLRWRHTKRRIQFRQATPEGSNIRKRGRSLSRTSRGGTRYSSRVDLRSTTDSAKLATPAAPFLVMTPLRFKKNPLNGATLTCFADGVVHTSGEL